MSASYRVALSEVRRFGSAVLSTQDVPEDVAADVLDVLLSAEARGFGSHGLLRLERVVRGLEAGTHNPRPQPTFEWTRPGCLWVDGDDGLGAHVAVCVMRELIERVAETGVAVASVHRMTHFGFGGYYTELAARAGLLGLVVCNTQAACAPFGGRGRTLGTNPISFSCALPGGDPVTVDMATTAIARGKVVQYRLEGTSLPEHTAQDANGAMTTDPEAALEGALLPLGGLFGYKGTALAVMIDVLAGALSGAATGRRVEGTADTESRCTAGFFFLVLDPAAFAGPERVAAAVRVLVEDLRASGSEVRVAGELEHARERESTALGIVLSSALRERLEMLGENCGVELGF